MRYTNELLIFRDSDNTGNILYGIDELSGGLTKIKFDFFIPALKKMRLE